MGQQYLDRRRPGGTKYGTPRREADRVVFLSGLYGDDDAALLSGPDIQIEYAAQITRTQTYSEGHTTGEPIAALVLSGAKKSGHYRQFAGPRGDVRPGHTDLVKYHQSRGFVDIRGGGRSSYRSTISDVVGGAIARLFLAEQFETVFLSSIAQVGPLKTSRQLADHVEQLAQTLDTPRFSPAEIARLEAELAGATIPCLDPNFAEQAAELITETRKEGDSLGAVVEVVALNVPPLAGDPLYQSLKLRLMGTLGGLHAAQSCEVGRGLAAATRKGSENNDPIRRGGYRRTLDQENRLLAARDGVAFDDDPSAGVVQEDPCGSEGAWLVCAISDGAVADASGGAVADLDSVLRRSALRHGPSSVHNAEVHLQVGVEVDRRPCSAPFPQIALTQSDRG